MARTVSIGAQDYARLKQESLFLIDKTKFIKEWWNQKDQVTLITRPRRFGKTLNLSMVERFFSNQYDDQEALFGDMGDLEWMNTFMNDVALATFSYFDTGAPSSREEPERFYHGFVLGLMVELKDRYLLRSNRESGFDRYDVMLEPRNPEKDDAILIDRGFPADRIRRYGFAFEGKTVLIGEPQHKTVLIEEPQQ